MVDSPDQTPSLPHEMNPEPFREQEFLDCFLEIVRSPYANFELISTLLQLGNDPESVQKTITRLTQQSSHAQTAFAHYTTLGNLDLEQLSQLPVHTLGYTYAHHLLDHQLKLIPAPTFTDPAQYLMFHLTEVHDIWHVVTGSDITMSGEIQLQSFVTAQLQFSRFSLAMLAKNLMKTALEDLDQVEQRMDALAQGWFMGKQAKPLFGMPWTQLWEYPLLDVQRELNIVL